MISKIKPDTEDFETYDFDLKELCKICGIETHGQNYQNFKNSIESLASKVFWIETEDTERTCHWIEKAIIHKNDTRVSIRFDKDLKPYLLQLRNNFTIYQLENILLMKSKYSIRLYELLKSYLYYGEYIADLETLKKQLQSAGYKRFNNFRLYVLEVATKEINQFTDLKVSYEPIREGRSVSYIRFYIKSKECIDYTKTMINRSIVLNGGDMGE